MLAPPRAQGNATVLDVMLRLASLRPDLEVSTVAHDGFFVAEPGPDLLDLTEAAAAAAGGEEEAGNGGEPPIGEPPPPVQLLQQ